MCPCYVHDLISVVKENVLGNIIFQNPFVSFNDVLMICITHSDLRNLNNNIKIIFTTGCSSFTDKKLNSVV